MSSIKGITLEEIEAEAAKVGCVAVFARSNELLLDLDDGAKVNDLEIGRLARNGILVESSLFTKSRNGGEHAYLRLNCHVVNDGVRVALQACLGSDQVRELLSAVRIIAGSINPTALFEKPAEYERVAAWRVPSIPDDENPF